MKRPTEEQFEIAAEWLRINDGDLGEAEACTAVADWLVAEIEARVLRAAARDVGVPVAALRRKLAERAS